MIEDWSTDGREPIFSSGEHGYESLSGFVFKSNHSAAYWRKRRGLVLIKASAGGVVVWQGRLEDVRSVPGGLRFMALGDFRAYTDAAYTRLWSTTGYANWEPVTADDISTYSSEAFEIDNNNHLYIAPLTSQTYESSASERGGLVFKGPHGAASDLKAISFTYELTAASGWGARLYSYAEGYTSETVEWTLTGSGSAQTGAEVITLSTARPYLVLALYRTAGGTTFAADIGTVYIKLKNTRLASTVTNQVSTTLGTSILAGTRTVSPPSMNNIYIGQKLAIGGTVSELVTVTSLTASTFTATFANGHINSDTVKAIYVSSEEIIKSLIAFADSLGTTGVKVNTGVYSVEDTDRDLTDEIYEDMYPADIMIDLANRHNFEVGVFKNRVLYYRPKGSAARTWYVDATVELERTLEAVYNSVYAVYADSAGRLLRTAVADDDDSIVQVGVTRRAAVFVDTSDVSRAEDFRDDYLETTANPPERAAVYFDRAFTLTGAIIPLFSIRAGDYIVARNEPGNPQFLVSRCEYDIENNTLSIEPSVRPPTVGETLAASLETNARLVRFIGQKKEKVRVI
jgi:hypothetical protein